MFFFLLSAPQDLRSKVFSELEATPDSGPQFAAAIRHLITGEDSWAAWKQASCAAAPLERPAAQPPAGSKQADLSALEWFTACLFACYALPCKPFT